jgi:hypothetical protein
VRVHHEADRADEEQRRRGPGGAVEQPQRGNNAQAARQPRRVVERHRPAEQLAEGEREPVIERRVLEPGLARDLRHHPVARAVHLVRDLDGDGIERLPGIVVRQPRKHEGERQERQHRGRGRQRETGNHVAILGPEN